ncbi:MAG: hypothetical protein J7623_29235 [Chitinophaga sp.]|uniref:hypothetical protein n=1 Tax=Chitinophaga sp. TaxID=1869181 RepID=UPI001B27BD70|nr:hypothetical protein [Chitinophaga sp.]MBO9732762.1 hypothetical protein [Chitinophaga sp.]
MKTPYIVLALGTGILASCHQQGQQQTTAVTDSLPAETEKKVNCYEKTLGKDTVLLTLTYQDSVATGKLVYNFFEKDKNTGDFNGIVHQGIIRGKYTFYSEGVESSRPVIFKVTKEQAFEAVPESFDKQGIPVFPADDNQLKFDSVPLEAGACK